MLPVPGVTFILGNDLAGGNVWEKSGSGVPPIVAPIVKKMDDSSNLFPACAITRAKAKKMRLDEKESILSDTFFPSVNFSQPECSAVVTSIEDDNFKSDLQPVVDDQVEKSGSVSESPFHCDGHDDVCSLSPLYSVTRDELIKERQSDDTLQDLFSLVDEKGGENFVSSLFF